jgi:hypothetical protein
LNIDLHDRHHASCLSFRAQRRILSVSNYIVD